MIIRQFEGMLKDCIGTALQWMTRLSSTDVVNQQMFEVLPGLRTDSVPAWGSATLNRRILAQSVEPEIHNLAVDTH